MSGILIRTDSIRKFCVNNCLFCYVDHFQSDLFLYILLDYLCSIDIDSDIGVSPGQPQIKTWSRVLGKYLLLYSFVYTIEFVLRATFFSLCCSCCCVRLLTHLEAILTYFFYITLIRRQK